MLTNIAILLASAVLITVMNQIAHYFAPSKHHFISRSKKLTLHQAWRLFYATTRNQTIRLALLGIAWLWLLCVLTFTHLDQYLLTIGLKGISWLLGFGFVLITALVAGTYACNWLSKRYHTLKYLPPGIWLSSFLLLNLFFASLHAIYLQNQAPVSGMASLNQWYIALSLVGLFFCGGLYFLPLQRTLQQIIHRHHQNFTPSINLLGSLLMILAGLIVIAFNQLKWNLSNLWLLLAVFNIIISIFVCRIVPHAVVQSFIRWTLQLFFQVKISGLEHYYNSNKRIIIIANHVSYLDILLIAAFIPDRLTFAINAEDMNKWWVRHALSLINYIQLMPDNPMSTKHIIRTVRNHNPCVIFPEGRLTTTGALMKIYETPALIADKANAMVLPIRIDGVKYSVFSLIQNIKKRRLFPKITLTILTPVPFDLDASIKGRQRREILGTKLFDTMTHMMFESSRRKRTLFEALLKARKIYGKKSLIAEDHQTKPISYNTLILKSYVLGQIIKRHTQKKAYVGLLLPNSLAAVVGFFGMQAFNRIPAMLNFSSGIHSILHCCRCAQVKTLITSKKFVEAINLQPMIQSLEEKQICVLYLEDLASSINIIHKIKGLVLNRFDSLYLRARKKFTDKDQAAVILFTSGSEGFPKGVVLSHENIQANRLQASTTVDFGPNDKCFNCLPMFHSFGLTTGTLLPILSGMPVILYPSPLHYRIIPEVVYDKNATMIFATNTFLSGYAKCAHAYDFYSVRYIFSGAEALKEATRQTYIDKFGIRILEGYGCTEASPLVAVNTFMQYRKGSVGRLLPGIDAKIEPVDGIEHGGRLFIKGPNIMLGYLKSDQPGLIQPVKNHWYDTGDIAHIDQEKYLFILGRAKRFAKIGGEMISLTYVESMIQDFWPDNMHAVIAQPDPVKGEQLLLITDHPQAQRQALLHYAKSQGYNELQVPNKIHHLAQLPVLGSGKVDYVTLKQQFIITDENN